MAAAPAAAAPVELMPADPVAELDKVISAELEVMSDRELAEANYRLARHIAEGADTITRIGAVLQTAGPAALVPLMKGLMFGG